MYKSYELAMKKKHEETQYLCYKAESGLTTITEYKELVENAKFLCKHCGRVCTKAESLHRPTPL